MRAESVLCSLFSLFAPDQLVLNLFNPFFCLSRSVLYFTDYFGHFALALARPTEPLGSTPGSTASHKPPPLGFFFVLRSFTVTVCFLILTGSFVFIRTSDFLFLGLTG